MPPVPTFAANSLIYWAGVSYNAGSAPATDMDIAALGSVTGSPTAWYLGATGTSTTGTSTNGGAISVSTAGIVSYTTPVGLLTSDTFYVRAHNAGGDSAVVLVTVPIGEPTFTASVADAAPKVGISYSQQVTLGGGQAPYGSFSATNLPPGLTISSTGVISGTPTTVGSYNVGITATDSSTDGGEICFSNCVNDAGSGYTGGVGLMLTVGLPPVPTFSAGTLTYGSTVAYNAGSASATDIDVAALGSVTSSPTAWYINVFGSTTSGSSNAGGTISVSTAGVVSYTPPVGFRATDSFYVRARNAGGESVAVLVNVNIGDPTFTASVADAAPKVDRSYSQQVTITGGLAPYSAFSATGLPPGLSMSTSGVISGTPTTVGSYTATVTVTDSSIGSGTCFAACALPSVGYTSTASLALTVGLPPVPTFPTAPITVSTEIPYNTGSASPTSIDVAALSAVTGSPSDWYLGITGTSTTGQSDNGATLTLSDSGTISYTPIAGYRGSDSFTVRANNTGGDSIPLTVLVTVGDPTFAASVATATATVERTYSEQVTISGGQAPYTTFSATGLPPGLSISSAGLITGTPTTAGSYTATITVTDSSTGPSVLPTLLPQSTADGYTGTASLALTVVLPSVPTFNGASVSYGTTIGYNTGSATETSIDVATLGAVTGSPTAFYVGPTGTATTGVSNNGASVSVSSAGVVSYTPVAGHRGDDSVLIRAHNAGGDSTPVLLMVTVGDPTFSASVADPTATVTTAYTQQVSITGGKAPYASFSATGLPPGLSISSSGLITGTPTTAGSYTATVTVTDSSTGPDVIPGFAPQSTASAYTGTASLALTVVLPPVPTFNAYPLTYGTTVSYNTGSATAASIDVATLGAVTGSPTVWYVDVSGTTTSGSSAFGGTIAITTAGVVSYTAPVGFYGTDNFDVRAVNAGGESAPVRVLVTVGQPSYTASVANANATVDTAYSQQVTIAGGKAPYSAFSATGLPPGLVISSDGLISGTPTTAGSYTATITVTDSSTSHSGGCGFCLLPGPSGYTGTASLALAVSAPGVPTFSSPALTYGTTLPYNTGAASASSIDVAALGAVTGAPTVWYVGSSGTATSGTSLNGAALSVTTAGVVSYTPVATIAAATASRSAPATAAASPSRSSCS